MPAPLHEGNPRAKLIGRDNIIPHPRDCFLFQPISPKPDKPTVVLPADFRIGRVESGFEGKPPDVILYINAAGIAGDGPTTQALQVSEGLKTITDFTDPPIPVYYVGPKNGASDISVAEFTGSLPHQLVEIPDRAKSIPEQFSVVTDSLTEAVLSLARQGQKNIFAVSTGYTAFVPYGLKQGIHCVKQEGFTGLKAILVNQDSSFPDTDEPSDELDPQSGYPLDRFNPTAYQSTDDVTIWMLTNQLFEFNIKYARHRAPDGILSAATTFPFTPEYIQKWVNWRDMSKMEARFKLAEMVQSTHPELASVLTQDAIFIPLFASGGYFDPTNVGKWMTSDQFQDMVQGSHTLIKALINTSQRTGKTVVVSGVDGFVDLVKSLNIPDVAEIGTLNAEERNTPKVILARSPRFRQSKYGIFHRAADVAINRTTQANTAAETLLAGVPLLVLTMPASGYMDSLKMDRLMYERGLRQYPPRVDPDKLGERIADIVTDRGYAAALVNQADNLFLQHHKNPGTNFMTVIAHIAGFPVYR